MSKGICTNTYDHASKYTTSSTDHARFEVIDDINNLLYVSVTIATLMKSKGPVGGHVWLTNHLLVLLDHLLRTGTSKQVEIQNTCNYIHNPWMFVREYMALYMMLVRVESR